MTLARMDHAATLLDNGEVLVAGGLSVDSSGNYLFGSSAEIYDPVTNTWSSAGSMATARVGQTATLLANGQVLVTGGTIGRLTQTSSGELYDPTDWSRSTISVAPATIPSGGSATITLTARDHSGNPVT